MSGDVTVKGVSADLDVGFDTIMDNLEFGAMGKVRVGYERWAFPYVGWHFNKWGSVHAGYRWVYVDYENGSGANAFNARQHEAMTDQDAAKLANDVFDLETKRTSLKRKHFKKFSKVVPARKAARFFQLENQLNMALDLQVAAALPLIK